MKKRTLEQAFNAVFHEKEQFHDFLNINLELEVELINIKDRVIVRQSDKLKKYLRFVDRTILRSLAKDDEVVHSFIKEKSTLTAVQAHVESKYYFLADIKEFYQSIKRKDVVNILERNKAEIPIEDIANYIDYLSYVTTYKDTLPIGLSTSPQLSNAFLFDFDREVKAYCIEHSLIYTRYADDIIISGDNMDIIAILSDRIQGMLQLYGSSCFSLKESKTRITWKGNKVKILGLVILPNCRITIDKKYKKIIEALLYFYSSDKSEYQSLLSKVMHGDEKSLFGLLHYANSIDPLYINKLQRKYGALSLHALMEGDKDDN
ncbi:reverse transcriptase family protein [Aeromonas media]|uniref:reverse transcriptase family protein n=1 Tax=Aeromonas media TaxID=651 RepID=UPI0038D166CF